MNTPSFRRITVLLTLAAGTLAAQNAPTTAVPGTVNYIEGSVSLDGRALNTGQNGRAVLQANQTLTTNNGKAEVLLSPGSFLRIGDNSEVRMVAPELVNPQVELVRGSAMLEVDSKMKDASVTVLERNANVGVLKEGLYRFDADQGRVEVYDGELNVSEDGRTKKLGKGKELALNDDPKMKTEGFDRKSKDGLYVWSEVRSGSLAEANASTAQYIFVDHGPYWGNGWYWNSAFGMYSWLPGNGYFYSPFGYPFYSVGYVGYYGPRYFRGVSGPRPIGPAARAAYVHAPVAARGFAAAPHFAGGGSVGFRGARR